MSDNVLFCVVHALRMFNILFCFSKHQEESSGLGITIVEILRLRSTTDHYQQTLNSVLRRTVNCLKSWRFMHSN